MILKEIYRARSSINCSKACFPLRDGYLIQVRLVLGWDTQSVQPRLFLWNWTKNWDERKKQHQVVYQQANYITLLTQPRAKLIGGKWTALRPKLPQQHLLKYKKDLTTVCTGKCVPVSVSQLVCQPCTHVAVTLPHIERAWRRTTYKCTHVLTRSDPFSSYTHIHTHAHTMHAYTHSSTIQHILCWLPIKGQRTLCTCSVNTHTDMEPIGLVHTHTHHPHTHIKPKHASSRKKWGKGELSVTVIYYLLSRRVAYVEWHRFLTAELDWTSLLWLTVTILAVRPCKCNTRA